MNQSSKDPLTSRRLKRSGFSSRPKINSDQSSTWSSDSERHSYETDTNIFDEYFEGEAKRQSDQSSRPKSGWGMWLPLVAVAVAGFAAFYKTIISGLVWASVGILGIVAVFFIAVLVWRCWRICAWLLKRGSKKSALLLAITTATGVLSFSSVMVVSAIASQPEFDRIISHGIATYLPHEDHLVFRVQDRSHLHSGDGRLVSAEEIRVSYVKYAILAIEDERYPNRLEGPVDLVATMRATVMTLVRGRRQGGSTIQLQVAKMLMGLQRVELRDKDVQTLLAFRLEQRISNPDEMLALYMNLCQINGDRRGMADAAYNFFGVTDLRQLTIEQAALLAALLKSPANYNPRTRPREALERRNLVLLKMRELGYISEQEYQTAIGTQIRLEPNLKRYELLVRAAKSAHGVGE